jgi:LysR family transcriptional regulator, regulator for bpeEF and oprC
LDRFLLMSCFARAAETGSFSAVARELGLSQPNISRYVAALEQHLETRLMHRSTRKLTLTPEGERYYAEVKQILDAVNQAESNARGDEQLGGLLRVACPTTLGMRYLMPCMRAFMDRYPRLELNLQMSDRYIDLVDEAVELAIRIGHLSDSALRARRIGVFRRVCVASVDYLERRGVPKTPADLGSHECIVYTLLSSGTTWSFRGAEVAVTGRFRVDSPDAVCEAVSRGMGIGYGPLWLFEDALRGGQLKVLLSGYASPPAPVQIVYGASRLLSRRATAFMEFVAQLFLEIPSMHEEGWADIVATTGV